MPTKREERPKFRGGGSGRNLRDKPAKASSTTAKKANIEPSTTRMMEAVVERSNMIRALRRVERNAGSAGEDGVEVGELRGYLKAHWPRIKEKLLEGSYQPVAVKRVEIAKPSGGMRQLGIPTVVDRLIQQALNQVLSPLFDGNFSKSSYGFRSGRSAHQAVRQAQAYVAGGRRWLVDIDLEKFFDRVNHDILMARVARRVGDKGVLLLIRRYLQAGIMEGGLVTASREGTAQGGPLSPLLSNIILDDLDKELERRGHWFCRYADDCNIHVRSRRAGQRVLASARDFLERQLKLKVNLEKSAVARPWERKFLGYSMTSHIQPRLKVARQSVKRIREKLKESFRQGKGRRLDRFIKQELTPILRGWGNYFQLAEVEGTFEELEGWVRRKLRQMLWRQWKRTHTRADRLIKRGLPAERAWKSAGNGRGSWWNAGASHMNEAFPKRYFDQLGLVSLLHQQRGVLKTA
ncbi:MAG: group II intron reverse transcriptase/maturase [Deltaproteobacteria bacterium]|nr:group II intron reverse transcriptase/maturase [Deltaproteobacteria bacterium]